MNRNPMNLNQRLTKRYDNEIVLAFADTHFPYQHRDTFKFLKRVKEEYEPDRVIHAGDLLDQYAFSAYPKAPNHESPSSEISRAVDCCEELAELFPRMDIIASNHDDRLYKSGTMAGIPKEMIVPYNQLIRAPSTWRWSTDLSITVNSTREKLYFRHTASGSTYNVAKTMGMTTVLAHAHSKFGIQGIHSPTKLIYAVDTGCLISDKGPPYAYNKGSVIRPIRGAVVIVSGMPVAISFESLLR